MKKNLTVYKASAGSGKTFTLAAEFIATALAEDASGYKNILAVTFTNKATAEMKERILQRLYDLWKSDDETGDDGFLKAVERLLPGTSRETLRRRAGTALRQIIHDYDHFRVETIDSFFQSLLSNLARELGLSANFKVDINDREVTEKAVDRLMLSLPDRPQALVWVLSYVKERIDNNYRWDITGEVKSLARNLTLEIYQENEERLRDLLDDSATLRAYRAHLKEIAEEALDHLANVAEQLDDEIRSGTKGYAEISYGSQVESFLGKLVRNELPEPSKRIQDYSGNAELWVKKSDKKKGSPLTAKAEDFARLLAEVLERREQAAFIINSSRLSEHNLNPLRLLNEINREVGLINEENNRVMLAKTPLLFDRLVGSDDASFVFEKAGTTFCHVMIDEFQDTSRLQWKNFKKLLVENLSTQDSCLLVGDVKQSIYRFRGGDWGILDNIEKELPNARMDIRHLDANFRSEAAIVAFNNSFFAKAAAELDRIAGTNCLKTIYSDVKQSVGSKEATGGYVRIRLTEPPEKADTETAEADMLDDLGQCMEALHAQGLPYGEMAILLRKNGSADAIIRHFSKHFPDIPLVSEEAFLLSSSPAVELLVHALRYLHDRTDTIALAYVTRTYQDLILKNDRSWHESTCGKTDLLPEAFSSRLDQLAAMPLYELAERLVAIFSLDRLKEDAAYVFAFLDQVMNFLEDNASDIAAFLTAWQDGLSQKAIPSSTANGARILTIHKSKGLAFHSVFMPYCDWDIEQDRLDSLLWCEPPAAPYNELPLVPIPGRNGQMISKSVYAPAYHEEHLQRRVDNLNLLYVAFTRARKNLYAWANGDGTSEQPKTIGDLLAKVLPESRETESPFVFESGTPFVTGRDEQAAAPKQRNPLAINATPIPALLQSCSPRFAFQQSNRSKDFMRDSEDAAADTQQEYISKGKLLHKVLSCVATTDDIEGAFNELQAQGILEGDAQKESLRNLLEKRLSDPRTARWFDGSWELFNECSILARDANGQLAVRRPDRVMTKPDETIVVDFKFGKPKPEYENQVNEYVSLLLCMGYPAVKGFLWYVYSGDVEEVGSSGSKNPTVSAS